MTNLNTTNLLADWTTEILEKVMTSNSICLALISVKGDLLFSNPAFDLLTKQKGINSFLHPSFESLVARESDTGPVFDGFLTLGDYDSFNTSINAQVFRKKENLLFIGGVEAMQMIEQNKQLAGLNQEIGNLQRNVLKKSDVLKKALDNLDLTNKELKVEQATRDKLFSVIAHDLRSPFGGILGFSEMLIKETDDVLDDEQKTYLGHIKASAKNTLNLLDNLLNWAKSQTGQLSYSPANLSFYSVVKEILSLYNYTAKQKDIELISKVDDAFIVIADQDMLNTILRNLISNAIKFTAPKGKVVISANLQKDFAEISVKDSGVGMNDEQLKKLFRYETSETTLGTAKEKGSGLGLLICAEFVEKLGGKIWAESDGTSGSDFKFTLPLIGEEHYNE